MSNISPSKPSFVFGYWRPWKEDSNVIDSYLDYSKDVSLAKYGADTVGKYISQASKEQIAAINHLENTFGSGLNILSNQMSDINSGINHLSLQMTENNDSLSFINRKLDIQIEQQILSNFLLQDIAKLLRVPDSEKERQYCIELGVKFFVNAKQDPDLFEDALEELLKAESMMRQDYFVLHRLGCIYLYVEKFINPEIAMNYFLHAAKYASVESDPKAMLLANVLTDNFSRVNSKSNDDSNKIKILASDSYEKAAFAAYVLGNFKDAVVYQSKALNFSKTAKNYFLLAKYQVRNEESTEAVKNLEKAIEKNPALLDAISNLMELDLASDINVLHLIKLKTNTIDKKIDDLIKKWIKIESLEAIEYVKKLKDLKTQSFEIKTKTLIEFSDECLKVNKKIDKQKLLIDDLLIQVKNSVFCTFNSKETEDIIQSLNKSKMLPLEEMEREYIKYNEKIKNDKIKIGSKFAGGVVFYLDNTGQHGLVCASKDFGNCHWGIKGEIGAKEKNIGYGMQNSKKILESSSCYYETVKDGWFSKKTIKKEISTAARLCLESNYKGFNDWYLPSLDECKLMYKNLHKNKIGNFKYDKYWSSTEVDSVYAIAIDFSDIFSFSSVNWNKSLFTCYVRAIRSF